MPQMSPLMWLSLNLYFLSLLILMMSILYFMKFYKNIMISKIKMNKSIYLNKW